MYNNNLYKKYFINIGLHLGGEMSEISIKSWGTYDLNTVATRCMVPFYNFDKIWQNIQYTLLFLQNSSKDLKTNFFFGSLTEDYASILEEASDRCHATFYGDSDTWIYGQYTNFLIGDRVEVVYLPDIINNDALFREFNPTMSAIIGIKTTDSMSNIDFPLLGNAQNIQHVLYYTHLISGIISRTRTQFVAKPIDKSEKEKVNYDVY